MALKTPAPIIKLIGNIAIAIRTHKSNLAIAVREKKSRSADTEVSTPSACLAFLFFGYYVGWFSFAFYRSFHLLGAFLSLTLLALSLGIAIWRGIISLGFKLYSWSAVIYAGFFIMGFAGLYYSVFAR